MDSTKKYMVLHKNNLMVKARYNLTSKENRIYLFILYNMQKQIYSSEDEILTCVLPRKDFCQVLTDIRDRGKRSIEKMLSALRSKPLYFIQEDLEGNKSWGEYGFISSYVYKEKTDTFTIKIQTEVLDLLKEYMGDGYTPLNMAIMFSLEGFYSQRLYELIRLWSNTKNTIDYKVDTLKDYMMLDTKKSYNLYANVKNKVIEPSIKELNDSGYLNITYEEIKSGRKVETLRFHIRDFDKRIYFSEKVTEKSVETEIISPLEKTPIKELESQYCEIINADKSMYIPDESIFTKGTLRGFKLDFKEIDFKNEYMQKAFNDAVMVALDRDDVEIIKAVSYKFFKGCLENKILEYEIEEKKEIKHKKEMEMYW